MPVFASTTLKLHPDDYTVISLPIDQREAALELFKPLEPFTTVTVDSAEVSLILKTCDWEQMRDHFNVYESEGPYHVITFDIVLDLSLIGYLSVVSAVLADAGISIYAVSTFLKDHILVKAVDSARAMRVLGDLIERCKITIN